MDDVKIKVIDSDKLINAINEGSYDVNLSAVMALGAVMLDTKKQDGKAPPAQPEIIRCKDCIHRPITNDTYNFDDWNCGFDIEFPDYRCPCRCDDEYYNRIPDDDWFCGNAERRTDG